MTITAPGMVFLLVTCFVLPWLAVRNALTLRRAAAPPTRGQILISVLVSQGGMLLLALMAARYEEVTLFPKPNVGPAAAAAFAGFLAVSLGMLPARWNAKTEEEKRWASWLMPHAASDLWWWALVALTAGIVEEIVFRGVMFSLWQRLLGSWWAAAAICIAAFALSHFVQGWKAMGAVVVIAFVFHGIVRWTGDLYTAMAAHFVYDLLAGFILLGLARRDGTIGAASDPAKPSRDIEERR